MIYKCEENNKNNDKKDISSTLKKKLIQKQEVVKENEEEKISLNDTVDYESLEFLKDRSTKISPINAFRKHRLSFCTVYLDFDSHSDKYHSELVNTIS